MDASVTVRTDGSFGRRTSGIGPANEEPPLTGVSRGSMWSG